jgi:acyl carrier protein
LPQVIVSKRDYKLVSAEQRAFNRSIEWKQLAPAVPSSISVAQAEGGADAAPFTQNEQTVALIWQEVLGVKRVGLHDNFFELGGNSLIGIQLMSHLRRAFRLDLPMSNLFASPTVAGLAAYISENLVEQENKEELERMIAEIENLSPQDLDARVAEATGADQQGGIGSE